MTMWKIWLFAAGLALCWEFARSRSRTRRVGLALVALALLAAQVALDGAVWTLSPLYAVVALGAALLLLRKEGTLPGISGKLAWAGAVILVCLSGFLAYALPVPTLPYPKGPYAVGTVTWEFDDATRKDPYAPTPDQPRKIMLQAWYPATLTGNEKPAAWSKDITVFGPAIATHFHLPTFLFDHLANFRSNSVENAPLKKEAAPWPVIVYSHGWTGFRTIALDEVEALASQGYVVFAPDHIYGALATVLKDGTPVLNNPKAMPPDQPRDAKRQAGIELLVDTYAGDLRFVLDTVEKMQAGTVDTPFKGALDLAKLGVFGHSTGGGAIYELAATDPRVKCAFGLDTWTEPISQDVRGTPLTVPFFSLRSAQWALNHDEKARILAELLAKAKGPVYDQYLIDSKHADFTLMPLLSPFAGSLGMTGPINGNRALEIGDAYLVAFFEQYLRGKDSPLLKPGSGTYAEVKPVEASVGTTAAAK